MHTTLYTIAQSYTASCRACSGKAELLRLLEKRRLVLLLELGQPAPRGLHRLGRAAFALTPRACDFGRVDRHEALGDGVGVGLRRFALRFCHLVDDLQLLQRLDGAIAEIHADERVRRTAEKRGYGAAACHPGVGRRLLRL